MQFAKFAVGLWMFTVLLLSAKPARAQETSPENTAFATQAAQILNRNCRGCHKGEGSESGYTFDVAKVASLVDNSHVGQANRLTEHASLRRAQRGARF